MKRKYLLFFVFIPLLFDNSVLFPQDFKKTATSGFTFLEIPVMARTAAMGEASIALSDNNSAALFSNPASLGFFSSAHSVSFSYSPWLAEINHYAASYLYGSSIGGIAIGFVMVDYGSMPRTVVASGQRVYEITGTFNASSVMLGISYSRKLTENFSFGLSLKYAEERIDIYKANNFLFDGGFLYYTGFGSLRIAGVIQNFGVNTKFINDEFKMPSALRLGLAGEILGSYDSEYRVTLIAEAVNSNNNTEKLNIGCEASWNNSFFIRGGYKFFYDEENLSFGFGIKNSAALPVSFDYSYSDYGRLGKISRISLQFALN